jgi:hypothetical protein
MRRHVAERRGSSPEAGALPARIDDRPGRLSIGGLTIRSLATLPGQSMAEPTSHVA